MSIAALPAHDLSLYLPVTYQVGCMHGWVWTSHGLVAEQAHGCSGNGGPHLVPASTYFSILLLHDAAYVPFRYKVCVFAHHASIGRSRQPQTIFNELVKECKDVSRDTKNVLVNILSVQK
mmetsp:Transcript_15086/g.20677  ORF Transcript_15086/g.20677 Transcript_15086/m.20677 type:complete len:120 (+) Transcript_15086:2-361(+)